MEDCKDSVINCEEKTLYKHWKMVNGIENRWIERKTLGEFHRDIENITERWKMATDD